MPSQLRRHPGEDDSPARASFIELFFDLVFVLAVTQLSSVLVEDLTVAGAVAFGAAAELDGAVAARLMQVNALGPIALIGAALPVLARPGAIVALSAVVADHPTAGMAAYSASKAALSAYLTALRREERRDGLLVLDVKPQHIETGFAKRALAGSPPPLKPGADPDDIVAAILRALRDDRRELAYDLRQRTLVPT